MSDKTCLLCGEGRSYDDPMCYTCENKELFPKRFELGGFGGHTQDDLGDWIPLDDVLWLVALWRLMQQVRETRSLDASEANMRKVFRVLDKLAQLEAEAKG